jgi:hypothetical protein
MYIIPLGMFKAMKKDAKNILFDSINIKTHNISDTIVDYYTCACLNIDQMS